MDHEIEKINKKIEFARIHGRFIARFGSFIAFEAGSEILIETSNSANDLIRGIVFFGSVMIAKCVDFYYQDYFIFYYQEHMTEKKRKLRERRRS